MDFSTRPNSLVATSVVISVIISALITCGIAFAFERMNAERVQSAQATLADIQTRGAALEASLKGLKTADIVEVQTTLQTLTRELAEIQAKMQVTSVPTTSTSQTQSSNTADIINIACLGMIGDDLSGLSDSDKTLRTTLLNKYCQRFVY